MSVFASHCHSGCEFSACKSSSATLEFARETVSAAAEALVRLPTARVYQHAVVSFVISPTGLHLIIYNVIRE